MAGAAVGNGVAVALCDGDGLAVALCDGDGLAVALCDGDGLAVALCDGDGLAVALSDAGGLSAALCDADGRALGVLSVAVELGEMLGDAEVLTPGDSFGSVTCGVCVQATTDVEATMAAKPTAVSLALNLVPAVVVRIFSDSSYLRRRMEDPRKRRRRSRETDGYKENSIFCPDIQWHVYHWTIRIRD